MKKIALLLLMFVAFQVSAQDFHFLPKIGLNLANMTNSDGSMKPGLNVGVAAEFPINPQFSVEPGIYYQKRLHKHSYLCKSLSIQWLLCICGTTIRFLSPF